MKKWMAAAGVALAGLGAGASAIAAGGAATAAPAAAAAPSIGVEQARRIGLVRAAAAGDAEPAVAVEADTSAEAVTAMAAPQGTALNEVQGGLYVVDMHGHFTLGQAHMPRGATAPSGTVMKVAVTREGFVVGIHLGES